MKYLVLVNSESIQWWLVVAECFLLLMIFLLPDLESNTNEFEST